MLSIFELKVLQKIVYFDKVKCLFCFKDEECLKSFILGQTFITIDDVASRNSISLSLFLSLSSGTYPVSKKNERRRPVITLKMEEFLELLETPQIVEEIERPPSTGKHLDIKSSPYVE